MDGLPALLRPIIRSLFVGKPLFNILPISLFLSKCTHISAGYVNMEVAMFLWDQYIIGLDTPGFLERFLPMVTATFLMLLHSSIVNCPSVRKPNRPPVYWFHLYYRFYFYWDAVFSRNLLEWF